MSCFSSLWFRGVSRRHARGALERKRECEERRKKGSPCNSLHCRRYLIPVSNVCKAAPRSEIPTDSMNYWKCVSNFLSTQLANQQIMTSLKGQSCGTLKSWYTGWDLEQGFWRCFAGVIYWAVLATINFGKFLLQPGNPQNTAKH